MATDTKSKIERAALELFAANGIDGTSIKEVATKAGVSQGAMYNHYDSKEELAWSLFANNYSELGWEMRRCIKESSTLAQELRAIIGVVYSKFEEDWALWSYVFFARHTFVNRVTPAMGNPFMVLRHVIKEAMRSGTIPERDLEIMTAVVNGAVLQVADVRILGRVKQPLTELSDEVASACIRSLGA